MSKSQGSPWEPQDPNDSDQPDAPQPSRWEPYPTDADSPEGPAPNGPAPGGSEQQPGSPTWPGMPVPGGGDQPAPGPTWPSGQPQWGAPPTPPAGPQPPWQGGQWQGGPWQQQQPWQEKPPVIPFRPLTLGELFEGTFAAIRSNPKVMFTVSVAVMLIVGLIAAIINGFVFSAWGTWDLLASPTTDPDDFVMFAEYEGLYQSSLAQMGLSVFQSLATLLVTGMLVLAVTNAVVANNMDLRRTWEVLRPRFFRLVLTALLVWVIFVALVAAGLVVVTIPILLAINVEALRGLFIFLAIMLFIAMIPTLIWVALRLSFSNMIVVVENTPVTTAIKRSWHLTRGAALRLLGRYLLLGIVMGIVMSLLGGAITVFTALVTSFAPVWVSAFVTTILLAILGGFALPVSASFSALMYVDERIRSENLAPVLERTLAENRERKAPETPA